MNEKIDLSIKRKIRETARHSFSISPHKSPLPSEHDSMNPYKKKIKLFSQGVKIESKLLINTESRKKTNENLSNERTEIKTFSADSRKRLRNQLLTKECIDKTLNEKALCLTIPGPIIETEKVNKLLDQFNKFLLRNNSCAIWRREDQQRGQQHFHMKCYTSLSNDKIKKYWLLILSKLEAIEHKNYQKFTTSKTCEIIYPIDFSNLTKSRCKSDAYISFKKGHFVDYYLTKDKKFYIAKIMMMGKTCNFLFDLSSKEYLEQLKSKTIVSGIFETGLHFNIKESEYICIMCRYSYKKYKNSYILILVVSKLSKQLPKNLYLHDEKHTRNGLFLLRYKDISKYPGAKKYAVKIDDIDKNSSNYFQTSRYLFDHTSKSKQEQVCKDSGRHWGVINRKMFIDAESQDFTFIDKLHFYNFLRMYQRLRTPMIRCDKVPLFRRKLGFKPSKCDMGVRCLFGNPKTVKRIYDHAKKISMNNKLLTSERMPR